MAVDEATLRKNWKITVGICLAYLAALAAFAMLMVLVMAEPLSTTQAKRLGSNQPSVTTMVEIAEK